VTESRFFGRHVCRELESYSPELLFVPRSAKYDLRDVAAVEQLFSEIRPDVVVHLAAVVGGIGAIERTQALFYDNSMCRC